MFKFLHAADLHLDSPLELSRGDGAPIEELCGVPTRRALQNLVQLGIDRQVDFVLIAGDLYDGDWRDMGTGTCFVREMCKLRDAGIPVYLISGNHDAESKITKDLTLPENVVRLSSAKPETKHLDGCGVSIHGQGFATPAVTDNLAAAYPAAIRGNFNIGLLHSSADVSDGHKVYAKCGYDDLRNKEYDYWALGHIHKRGCAWGDDRIRFSGNLQGRKISEADAKGCLLVTVDDALQPVTEFVPLDVLRWQPCLVDAQECESCYDVLDRTKQSLAQLIAKSDGRRLAVRIDVVGACAAHEQLSADASRWMHDIRLLAGDVGDGDLWIEKIRFQTSPPRVFDETALDDGPLGELVDYIADLQSDPESLVALASEALGDLWQKLPDKVKESEDALRPDDAAGLGRLLDQIKPLLISRLRGGTPP